jgi:uncharacterized protein YlxP (DUF503 family)
VRVGWIEIVIRIEGISSLKDKRRVVRHLTDSLRQRFRVSVAEVADQGLHNHATIGAATVSSSVTIVAGVLDQIQGFVESHAQIEVIGVRHEVLHA